MALRRVSNLSFILELERLHGPAKTPVGARLCLAVWTRKPGVLLNGTQVRTSGTAHGLINEAPGQPLIYTTPVDVTPVPAARFPSCAVIFPISLYMVEVISAPRAVAFTRTASILACREAGSGSLCETTGQFAYIYMSIYNFYDHSKMAKAYLHDHSYMFRIFQMGHIGMSAKQAALGRKNLEKRLAPLRAESIVTPPRGWAKAIREALGMTTRQLAKRMGAAPSRVSAIEKAEMTGAITLKTLRETAEAMDCVLLYAFVPTKALDHILRDQAERKASGELSRLNHTMGLENQALTKSDLADERERMVDDIVSGSLRGLWDDE